MKEQEEKLKATRCDLEEKIDKMNRATNVGEAWIRRVTEAEKEVLELEGKYNKETVHAWRYARSWSRANLSKHMAKKRDKLKVLLEGGKLDDGGVVKRSPEPVRVIDAPSTKDFPSLHWAVDKILRNLREREFKRIGLWGLVGIGKTTVMQNLNNSDEVKNLFDIVLWVSVSKAGNTEKVQNEITQRLMLKVEGEVNRVETAQLIKNKLEDMRYLLLLDQVCDYLNLKEVGIPSNDKGSKVVFASRFRDVCHYMDADVFVKMQRLSDTDAYKMFKEKVGRTMADRSAVATLVVRKCAGLPLVIDRVAKVFGKKDDVSLWRDELRRLQRWPSIKIQGMNEMLEFLKFCYEDLDGEDKKVCFLYGALFPEDSDIFVDYLVECWKAEGFLHSVDEFRDARDRGHNILDDLINVSLLEKSAMKRHVRMNGILRNMALKISSGVSDRKILARPREELKEAPKEEEWASASQISLMDNDLCSLPTTSNCTNLSTLLLQRNKNLMMIPESFFSSMQGLRVLDLHATAITSLPPSLRYLTHLRALYLNSCKGLIELPSSLEALVHLEMLDIRHTGIIALPIQVGSLTQMRCLRMSLSNFDATNLMSMVISSISSLEELMIDVDPNTSWSDQVMRIITEEVSTLTRLTSLTFSFPKVECLEIFIRSSPLWKNLRFTFQFSVGICNLVKHHILDYFEYQLCKCLKYANDEGTHPVISEVLTETEAFELIDHKNIESLSDFGTENLSELRTCSVEGCKDITCIIDGERAPDYAFKCLERMVINNAPKLDCFWKGSVTPGSLGRMTSLTLLNCPELKNIVSKGLIEKLSMLKHLSVENCSKIEEIIIGTENPSLDPETLPSLETLVLRELPNLRSIAPDDLLIWSSLKKQDIDRVSCPSLLKLPSTMINATN
ncbi:hypothetical protein EUGRSUZ_L00913 [Eucalyptus grandis]|uniref:Uncharacterized protein n=1 Tax=Eucalyptus grandis TaxID=71139 RepID=A0A058ZVD7_EUCGR|nr:hypothetical protein EUGRSUZ_L00913 [Eucalyptus grandis]